jgi:hypothetical protein
VQQLLQACKPPLLGRGAAIPPATLAAFRCGVHLVCGLVLVSFVCLALLMSS